MFPKQWAIWRAPADFAVFMGISRALYGKAGGRIDLTAFMMLSAALCLVCYLVAGLANIPMLGLVGCMLCGFAVGIMWPGSISISSSILPSGGTAMFALLALAGDMGASMGPALVGTVSQIAGDNLQAGILAGAGFPAVLAICVLLVRKWRRGKATPASLMPRPKWPQTKSGKRKVFPALCLCLKREKAKLASFQFSFTEWEHSLFIR